jgi:stage II sporulation protein D
VRAWPALLVLLLCGASPAPDDDLAMLYAHGLSLGASGEPLVTVRIDDAESQMVVSPAAAARLLPRGGTPVDVPAGPLTVRVTGGKPGVVRHGVVLEEVDFRQKAAARAAAARWTAQGTPATVEVLGGVYGIHGRVLDTRRYAVVATGELDAAGARDLAARIGSRSGVRAEPLERMTALPSGTVEVRDAAGKLLAAGAGLVTLDPGAGSVNVRAVEHDEGYDAHGREDRSYRGRIHLLVGGDGALAAVNALPLEDLLRGIVPSEMYATAPAEALRAQAVTARGEILAKIGARHLADPWAICGEQHCQVYRGASSEQAATDAAVAATRGEVLVSPAGRLVRSVFSSTCGGHTEDADAVWGGLPDPVLQGVPDWDGHPELAALAGRLDTDEKVRAFLAADVPAMCRAASLSRPEKYRWERRFTATELDRLLAPLALGRIVGMQVDGRGSSGRARALAITGERGATVVRGELTIRRLLRNLNSSLFVIERDGPEAGPATAWVFRGAGWGHGVGMCQMGAIGRAEAGQDHAAILQHYYRGARLERLY